MRKAQSSLEYAVLIIAVVAALIAMTIYLKRGMQGKFRQGADELGSQYEPGKTTSDITLESSGHVITNVTSTVTADNKILTTINTNIESERESRHGTETVLP